MEAALEEAQGRRARRSAGGRDCGGGGSHCGAGGESHHRGLRSDGARGKLLRCAKQRGRLEIIGC